MRRHIGPFLPGYCCMTPIRDIDKAFVYVLLSAFNFLGLLTLDRNQPLSDSREISQILLCHYCDRKKHLSEGNARTFTLNGVNCTQRAEMEQLAFFLKSKTTSLKRTAEGCKGKHLRGAPGL